MKKKDPTTQEAINLLDESNCEIINLRAKNEVMGARLQMFDDMMALMRSQLHYPSQGFAPDVVHKNRQFITENK